MILISYLFFLAVSITSGYTETDQPQPGMKRSAHQAALDAYSYPEHPERYQANIAVSAQSNQVHQTLSSGSLTNYTPSHYAYLPTEFGNVYSLGQHMSQHAVGPSQVTSSEPQAVSLARPSQVEDATDITAPHTPPLSPVMGHVGGESHAPPLVASYIDAST